MDLTCQPITDQILVAEWCQGDQEGFALLYQRYFDKVYHKCASMIKDSDAAYDLAQDSLLKAYENIGSFHGASSFATWLFAITRNECLQYLRRIRYKPTMKLNDIDNLETVESGKQIAQQQAQEDNAFAASLQQLSQEDQQLLLMKYWQKASTKEIQESLGLATPSAVKMRLHRSRKRLLCLYQLQCKKFMPDASFVFTSN